VALASAQACGSPIAHTNRCFSKFAQSIACGFANQGPREPELNGYVTTAEQQPIKAQGAVIEVRIRGVSQKSGENITYAAQPGPDGHYQVKLAPGRFQATATLTVPFGGETFRYDLAPAGPKPATADQDSADGPVFNFEWRLSGLQPGAKNDPTNWANWIGGPVDVKYDRPIDPNTHLPIFPPKGTKFLFTLTPKGKLFDGSTGKPLMFERNYDDVQKDVDNDGLPDIPLGNYELTGKQVDPGAGAGAGREFVFSPSTDQKTYALAVALTFKPRGIRAAAMGQLFVFHAK
jgi:hypothetical protein